LHLYRKLIEVNDAKVKELRDEIERNRNFMAKRKGALKSPEPSPSRRRARDMIERETNRLLASAVEEQKQSIANAKAANKDTQSRILNIAQQGIAKLEDDNYDAATRTRSTPHQVIKAMRDASHDASPSNQSRAQKVRGSPGSSVQRRSTATTSSHTASQQHSSNDSSNANVARVPPNHPVAIAAAARRAASASSAALGTSNPALCHAVHYLDANASDLNREERHLQEVAQTFFGLMESYSEDPTHRPMYSDIDMVNIRSSRLRNHSSGTTL
jgi:hypothetical protein